MRTYTYGIETIRTGTVTVTVPDDKTLEQVWSEVANFMAADHHIDEIPGIKMDDEEIITLCEVPDDYSSAPRTQEFLIQ